MLAFRSESDADAVSTTLESGKAPVPIGTAILALPLAPRPSPAIPLAKTPATRSAPTGRPRAALSRLLSRLPAA